jgi:hypothetical protein
MATFKATAVRTSNSTYVRSCWEFHLCPVIHCNNSKFYLLLSMDVKFGLLYYRKNIDREYFETTDGLKGIFRPRRQRRRK